MGITIVQKVWCDHCHQMVTVAHGGMCSQCGDKIEFDDGTGCCGCSIIIGLIIIGTLIGRYLL